MIKQRSLPFLLGICVVFLAGCGTFGNLGGGSPIVGTWTNSIGTVWSIKKDGTFDVDLNHNGKRDAWGTYKIDGDQITLQRTGGIKPKGCDGKGVYEYERDGDTLKFTLVSDRCKLRQKNVLTTWRAKR